MKRLRRDVAQFQQIQPDGPGRPFGDKRVSLKAIRADVIEARSYASAGLVRQLARFDKVVGDTSKMLLDNPAGMDRDDAGRILEGLAAFTSSWQALAATVPQCHLPDVPGGVVYG